MGIYLNQGVFWEKCYTIHVLCFLIYLDKTFFSVVIVSQIPVQITDSNQLYIL